MPATRWLPVALLLAPSAAAPTTPAPATGPVATRAAPPVPAPAAAPRATTGTARVRDTLRLAAPGLREPVTILRDRWGIAHIYAANEHDLFFAQGWSAARNRLFQFELWRRRATGTVAEILGPRAVERDVGARLFRYRGDLQRELDHYHPRGAAIVRAFVAGVNAWIERTLQNPDLLPPEFDLLGIRPGRWTPEVLISRHGALLGNIRGELAHGRAVHRVGPDLVQALEAFGPGEPDLRLDPDVDGELLFRDLLAPYTAWRRPIDFRPEDVVPARRRSKAALARLRRAAGRASTVATATVPAPADPAGILPGLGTPVPGAPPGPAAEKAVESNNWVVAGEHTRTGRPFMANDPHRAQQAPSLRYFVHLHAPGWNVIGGGEPQVPGVSIGHNEHGAWGLTVFPTDNQDLYVYETRPGDPDAYRYRDDWERMRELRDTIRVRDGDPVVAELAYTRHGPVVHRDTANRVAYAVRAAWLEPGGAQYLASLRMDQARTWEEFREACSYSNIPGENFVWADTSGTIGWQAVGIAPIRRSWSGLVPVPGDGRYEWDGYLPIKAKPHVVNPGKGFWATANNELIPEDYPYRDAVGWEWADPFRAARLEEVLGSGRRHSLREMAALQTDYLSLPARDLVPLLEEAELPAAGAAGLTSSDLEAARQRLTGWDRVLSPGSVAAGIYVAWERRLVAAARERFVPASVRDEIGGVSMHTLLGWLQAPDGRFGVDPVAGRDAFLVEALGRAVAGLRERLGPEPEGWRYGQPAYKHALIRHPLSEAVGDSLRRILDVGPAPRGGNSYTVNNTGWGNNQTSGASFRVIVDVGAWNRSLATNAPGQSGTPGGPHYRDLFPLWAADRYFPLLFSREKVESVTGEVIRLSP